MYRCTSVLVHRCTCAPVLHLHLHPSRRGLEHAINKITQNVNAIFRLKMMVSNAAFWLLLPAPPPKKRKNGSQKYGKKPYEVHLEVTRLERHAIFRRSISLDDVDCFEALKSHTYQSHEFITLLFIELRGPFRVVLMRASCQSRFLCDVIERNRTPTLSYCHLAAFTVPHKTVSGPSCGPAGSGT